MRYMGSKTSVVDQLYSAITEYIDRGTLCDPFGGIGTVGAHFKSKGFRVITGDQLTFAHHFQIARIRLDAPPSFDGLRAVYDLDTWRAVEKHLNGLEQKEGWFSQNYGVERKFFTMSNAKSLEACRSRISLWRSEGSISEDEWAFLCASLINSMDKVANTAGTYYAYLKEFYRKALKKFEFEFLSTTASEEENECHHCEAKDLVEGTEYDVLYLDPPYNSRAYPGYYHLPETIARGETPEVHGKAGIPKWERPQSAFNRTGEAKTALESLVHTGDYDLLVFHYSDDGIIPPSEVKQILGGVGEIDVRELASQGYTTQSGSRESRHRLYIVDPR